MTSKILSEPLKLPCGVVIPNRLCKAAMTESLADEWGRPTRAICRLYEHWSAGGCGLLITGNVQVDRRYIERPGNVCIDGPQDDQQLGQLRAFAKAGHSSNSLVFAQIGHAGRQSNGLMNLNPVGPGNIRISLPKQYFGDPRALTVAELEEVKARFVHACKVCQDTGFDGVQIHSAHGYLLSSFLNPRANNRAEVFGDSDPYGGSLENRSRLLLETVRDVRAAVGPSFPISVKLNSADFQEGGFTAEEAVEVALMLEREGVDLLEISGGNYESGIFQAGGGGDGEDKTDANGGTDKATKTTSASTARREAYFLQYAVQVTKALTTLPVMVTGGWRSRVAMEAGISSGDCAMIGLGRPLCGEPECAKALLEGRLDCLPMYENQLQTGMWYLQWIYALPIPLLATINMVGKQAWYYRQIYSIGDNGAPNHQIGCFAAYLENDHHEKELAAGTQGGVQCEGSVYSYKKYLQQQAQA